MSPEDAASLQMAGLVLVSWAAVWALAWLVVWRRRGQKWPLLVGIVPMGLVLAVFGLWIFAFAFVGLIPGILGAVAMGKAIIAFAGRRAAFARSAFRAAQPKAPPRGLVESVSNET